MFTRKETIIYSGSVAAAPETLTQYVPSPTGFGLNADALASRRSVSDGLELVIRRPQHAEELSGPEASHRRGHSRVAGAELL